MHTIAAARPRFGLTDTLSGDGPAAALWAAAVGLGVSRPLRRVLARARQCLLGRHHRGDRVSATSWGFAAQGLVPDDRHRGRRRGDRGSDRCFPQDRVAVSRRSWRCGALCALSSPRFCTISRPTRRRSPATRPRSSQPTSLARPAARTPMRSSCSRSTAPARSASVSYAPASFSPGPISAAPGAGSPRYSRLCRPKSRAGLPACWRWPGRKCRRRNLSGASSSGASSRSTRSSTRRSENPPNPLPFAGVAESRRWFVRALDGWRTVAALLARLPDDEARQEADAVLRSIPPELRSAEHGAPARWMADPVRPRRACETAVRTLTRSAGRHAIAAAACRPDG